MTFPSSGAMLGGFLGGAAAEGPGVGSGGLGGWAAAACCHRRALTYCPDPASSCLQGLFRLSDDARGPPTPPPRCVPLAGTVFYTDLPRGPPRCLQNVSQKTARNRVSLSTEL